jgi:hypothetical protein
MIEYVQSCQRVISTNARRSEIHKIISIKDHILNWRGGRYFRSMTYLLSGKGDGTARLTSGVLFSLSND